MEFSELDDVVGIWFVGFPDHLPQDWMLTVKALPAGGFEAEWRMRYYRDDKAFDSDDRKSWHNLVTPKEESRASVMRKCRFIAASLSRKAHGEMFECVRGKDESLDSFLGRFKRMPFVHFKELKPGDPDWEKYGGKS